MSEQKPAIAIAGTGAVARALGKALQEVGVAVACVASRDPERAGAEVVRYRDVGLHASHVIIAVADRAIGAVAQEIAAVPVRVALHTCGAHGAEILAPLSDAGVACGSFHPLQTFRGTTALRGVTFAVNGDPGALQWAEELAATLRGHVIHIESESRPLYHAAAVMASNYVAALLDSAEHLMELAGVPRSDARRALEPLVRTGIDNVFASSPVDALTGPVVRGDATTVASHVRAMRGAEQSVVELYQAAGQHALDMARRRGLLQTDAENVRRALVGRE